MWLPLLMACGPGAPEGVPSGALHVTSRDADLVVGSTVVGPWSALAEHPTDDTLPQAAEALRRGADQALWFDLPADTPWFSVRKLINTAAKAGSGPSVLSVAGTHAAFPLADPPQYGLGDVCPDGPLDVFGAQPLITLSLQGGPDGAWVIATARFLPVVERHGERGPVDGLPARCVNAPSCTALFAEGTPNRAACEQPDGAKERVRLGGETGCLLPIARTPDASVKWRAELPALVTELGLGSEPLVMVMPEARTRTDALVAVLAGFADSERAVPAVGATLLIQGNDGPPVCNASVRNAAALSAAGARWLGALAARSE